MEAIFYYKSCKSEQDYTQDVGNCSSYDDHLAKPATDFTPVFQNGQYYGNRGSNQNEWEIPDAWYINDLWKGYRSQVRKNDSEYKLCDSNQ